MLESYTSRGMIYEKIYIILENLKEKVVEISIFLKVIIGDAEEGLKEIETDSVQLTITSPPYVSMRGVMYWESYHAYMQKMRDIFTEVYRVTETGRCCTVNVGDYVEQGVKYPLIADYIKMLQGLGFTYEDLIIWVKPQGVGASGSAGSRAGNFIKYGNPLYFRPNNLMEGIIIMRKGEIDYKKYPKIEIDYRRFYDFVGDVWNMTPVSHDQFRHHENHPAPFPYKLPYNVINLYTLKGELVIDPFCGTGTTMRAAKDSFRNSIGFELDKKWLPQIKVKTGYGDKNLSTDVQYEIIEIGKKAFVEPPEIKYDKSKEGLLKWM